MGLFRKKDDAETATGFSPEEPAPPSGRPRLTPVDVQEKVFRLSFRGYNEREVDEFLDVVTENLAALHEENKRMSEELELRGGGSDDARRHAEETVRRARAEAARIVEEAERQSGGGGGTGVSAAFLARERSFLQELATLVQEHADRMRGEARRIKREVARARSDQESPDLGETEAMSPVARAETDAGAEAGDRKEGPEPRGGNSGGHEEPSLKELFWGEE